MLIAIYFRGSIMIKIDFNEILSKSPNAGEMILPVLAISNFAEMKLLP